MAEQNQMQPKKRGRPPGSKNKKTIQKETALHVARSRPMSEAMKTNGSGKASAAVAHVLTCMEIGKQADINNIDSLALCLQQYLQACLEQDFPVTAGNCYLALHVDRRRVHDYTTGTRRQGDPRYKEFFSMVKLILEGSIESSMAFGTINPVIGIWWEKAHFGMVEAQKEETVTDDPLGERRSAQEIREKYAGLLPD